MSRSKTSSACVFLETNEQKQAGNLCNNSVDRPEPLPHLLGCIFSCSSKDALATHNPCNASMWADTCIW